MKWIVGVSRTVYECPWLRLEQTEVTFPDGRALDHHVIRVPGPVVAVLAVDAEDRVLLLHRHRFITDRWGWELPAGGTEAGEDPADAAARELAGETGVRCARIEPLGSADLSNGLSDQSVLLYRGTGIRTGGAITSPEESSEIRWFGPDDVNRLLADQRAGHGGVPAASTQLALLLHRAERCDR